VAALKKNNFHGEVARRTNEEKIAVLDSLKGDVRSHLQTIRAAPPIIDTKTPIPKLFN
jgi:hypothetical protein